MLKKAERNVIPRVIPHIQCELEELCQKVRQAMGSGDQQKIQEAVALLCNQLLCYAHLL